MLDIITIVSCFGDLVTDTIAFYWSYIAVMFETSEM